MARQQPQSPAPGTYQNPQAATAIAMPPEGEKRGIDPAIWSVLTTSIFLDANPQSVLAAWDYCVARKLDILKKPCHIVPMRVGDVWRDVILPGIYEIRTTAMRTGEYVGQSDPTFGPMVDVDGMVGQAPEWCRISVFRMQHGKEREYPHIAYFDEECARKSGGEVNSMWSKRKRGQLAKVAEAGALRKAFPDELGGEMTADEMHGKAVTIDSTAEPVTGEPAKSDISARVAENADKAGAGDGEDGPPSIETIEKMIDAITKDTDTAEIASLLNTIAEPAEKRRVGKLFGDKCREVGITE